MRAPPRRQRWAGPPPFLILTTVVGFLAAWALSAAGDPTPDQTPARAELVAAEASESPSPTADGPPPAAEPGRKIDRRHVIGVVSFNQYRKLSVAQARADALSITGRDQVDIVGWQEAYSSAPVFDGLRNRDGTPDDFPPGPRSWPSRGAGRTSSWSRRRSGWWRAAWTRRSAATRSRAGTSCG